MAKQLHEKHAVQRGIWVPTQHLLWDQGIPVYCENYREHTDTVRISQETHYVSVKEPNRLMLFGERVVVHCHNHTEHTKLLFIFVLALCKNAVNY
jgi:hypothetical protein